MEEFAEKLSPEEKKAAFENFLNSEAKLIENQLNSLTGKEPPEVKETLLFRQDLLNKTSELWHEKGFEAVKDLLIKKEKELAAEIERIQDLLKEKLPEDEEYFKIQEQLKESREERRKRGGFGESDQEVELREKLNLTFRQKLINLIELSLDAKHYVQEYLRLAEKIGL